jgi:hypothetical protein
VIFYHIYTARGIEVPLFYGPAITSSIRDPMIRAYVLFSGFFPAGLNPGVYGSFGEIGGVSQFMAGRERNVGKCINFLMFKEFLQEDNPKDLSGRYSV